MGAAIDTTRANGGNTVYYTPCWDGTKHAGATIMYWDYTTNSAASIIIGAC